MKLTSKCIALCLACVAAPLAAFSWLAFESSRDLIGEVMHSATVSTARDGMTRFTELLADGDDDLYEWSRLQEMQDVLIDDLGGDLKRALQSRLSSRSLFRTLLVLDRDGQPVASAGLPEDADWRGTDAFRHARAGRRFNSGVVDDAHGRAVMVLSAPLRASYDAGTIIGVLVGVVDWSAVQRMLATLSFLGRPQDADHRFVLVSRSDGRLLYDTLGTGAIALPREPGHHTLTVEGKRFFVATAHPHLGTASDEPDADGAPWTLHVMLATDLAYARAETLMSRYLVVGCLVLGLVTLVMFMALRATLRPLLALSRASDRLAANDYLSPLPVAGHDEIGTLTRSFDRMRDAVARHNAELEAEVGERRNAEQRALQAEQQALEASRAKSRFLAAMSHEIRTPINGVLGMTDLLLKSELKPQQRRFAENIERSGEVLLGVVNDILDLSRIEAGRFELDDAPFDLRVMLEDAVDMLAESAERKRIELGCVIPADLPTAVRGDVLRLRQVLTNLLGNAVKFTEQGEVVMRVECLHEQPGSVLLRFEVRDTGIGMRPEALNRIFDTFSQADASTTRRFGGTGLGLSIARNLIELMGGEIGVESQPGAGSTFWFTAPLARSESASAPTAEGSMLAGLRVLVVDDNATNREILSHQLTDLGAEHASAASGEEALAVLLQAQRRGDPFDAAVIDHQMPGMSGLELARAVRAQPTLSGLSLVMLSSIAADASEDWRGVGVESRLTKPIRRAELQQCLAAACRRAVGERPASVTATMDARRVLEGRRVLLAEDHPVNREVAVAMLELLGCETVVAEDGQQALDALQRESFDIVLMDCDMPVLDGYEATLALRRRESESGGPRSIVVALTANSLEGDRERCLQAGMDDYLSKPVVTDTLREMLLRWLPVAAPTPVAEDAPGPGGSADPPALDARVIDGIRATNRDKAAQLLRELAARYSFAFERDLQALRSALEAGNTETARKLAHRLKSSSATLGARGLAARCQTLETAVASGAPVAGDAAVDDLYTEYQRVQHALDEQCRRVA